MNDGVMPMGIWMSMHYRLLGGVRQEAYELRQSQKSSH